MQIFRRSFLRRQLPAVGKPSSELLAGSSLRETKKVYFPENSRRKNVISSEFTNAKTAQPKQIMLALWADFD
ncbi:hypothetical protein SD81_027495 [Tolypothrix campylonemoides VB511288]|nr:hypothetical protein SD81_027495 [Tolypothrix campylonemoides VB511288]